jgi:hypothetical protein
MDRGGLDGVFMNIYSAQRLDSLIKGFEDLMKDAK